MRAAALSRRWALFAMPFAIAAAIPVASQAAPLDALQDSFANSSVDAALWTVAANGGTASERTGTLDLVPDAVEPVLRGCVHWEAPQ